MVLLQERINGSDIIIVRMDSRITICIYFNYYIYQKLEGKIIMSCSFLCIPTLLQLEGKINLLPKDEDMVKMTISKHGVKVFDQHEKVWFIAVQMCYILDFYHWG